MCRPARVDYVKAQPGRSDMMGSFVSMVEVPDVLSTVCKDELDSFVMVSFIPASTCAVKTKFDEFALWILNVRPLKFLNQLVVSRNILP